MFRDICEAREGILPSDLQKQTFDQLYILVVAKPLLATEGGRMNVTVDDLRKMGRLPSLKPGEATSHVQRLRAKKAAEAQKSEKQLRREKRRKRHEDLAAARARGEA